MGAALKDETKILEFPSTGKKTNERFDNGFIMSSRKFRFEVLPFLKPAAIRVYLQLENAINAYHKESDHVSYSQLQGIRIEGCEEYCQIMSTATVREGLKELLDLKIINLIEENRKLGNRYSINEISLIDYFRNKSALESKALQKLKHSALETKALGTLESKDTIRYIFKNILDIKPRFAKKPLVFNFYTYEIRKKKHVSDQRAELSRPLSPDEVMQLTTANPIKRCDPVLWETFVYQNRKKKSRWLTKNAIKLIWDDFKNWGYEESNAALKRAISSNSQGLFSNLNNKKYKSPSPSYDVNSKHQTEHFEPAVDDIDLTGL